MLDPILETRAIQEQSSSKVCRPVRDSGRTLKVRRVGYGLVWPISLGLGIHERPEITGTLGLKTTSIVYSKATSAGLQAP